MCEAKDFRGQLKEADPAPEERMTAKILQRRMKAGTSAIERQTT